MTRKRYKTTPFFFPISIVRFKARKGTDRYVPYAFTREQRTAARRHPPGGRRRSCSRGCKKCRGNAGGHCPPATRIRCALGGHPLEPDSTNQHVDNKKMHKQKTCPSSRLSAQKFRSVQVCEECWHWQIQNTEHWRL